ncbi:RNA-directed DNA polymerase, eukaryota, reverse transcriptase zinc-binding domain protein, partial [Tanacetum coccineum]
MLYGRSMRMGIHGYIFPVTAQNWSYQRNKGMNVPFYSKKRQCKKNDVKARSLLLMALPNEHQLTFDQYVDAQSMFAAIKARFGGNEATKKTLLRTLLAILGVVTPPEDLNVKFLRSLPSEWDTHVVVWMNKPDFDTMGLDDFDFPLKFSTDGVNNRLTEGDETSKYFHGILKQKRSQMAIRVVLVDGEWFVDPSMVKNEFFTHFSQRFSKLDSFRIYPFLEQDIMAAVNEFFTSGTLPRGCNCSFITLILKIQDSKVVKDFRPITLIGSIYKIIAKILANRLSFIISDLISDVQSAFITNRQILDGPFILNELLSYDYLEDVLKMFSFGNKWGGWINGCLNSAMGSVLVNGSLTSEFQFHKGCSTFSSPFTHLGVKVGGVMSRIKAWDEVISKLSYRLSKWKLKTLSIGGRLTLIKSVLSYIPNDRDKVLASKKYGGLGVSSFFAFNRALLFKWIWRFLRQGSSLWVRFIKAIYGDKGTIDSFDSISRRSPWLDIIRESLTLTKKGIDLLDFVRKKVGNGEDSLFWEDNWLNEKVLKHEFPVLFVLESSKQITVADKLKSESFATSYRRVPRRCIEVNIILIKINVFAWRVHLDNIPTRLNLSLRGVDIPFIICPICNISMKSTSHHLFSCTLARQLRRLVVRWWELEFLKFISYEEWLLWLNTIRISKGVKENFEGVNYVMWWLIW